MPRELSDVLHYFLPEVGAPADPEPVRRVPGDRAGRAPARADANATRGWEEAAAMRRPPRAPRCAAPALPIIAVPIDDDDVVRAALLWNLGVEIARRGGRSLMLRPASPHDAAGWPPVGRQPLGAEVVDRPARDLGDLYRAAVDAALLRAREPDHGVVLVRVPPPWIDAPGEGAALLGWTLLLTRSEAPDLRATWRRLRAAAAARPDARLGVTIHGATSRADAQRGFSALARAARERLGRDLSSYGLLVDDLHVYRAVAARRPIGLAHPQSLAARALHDVAGLLLEDARALEAR